MRSLSISTLSNDSLRKLFDSLYTAKIDSILGRHSYYSSKGKGIKFDTTKMSDGTLVVIEHIDDGRCMCKYVKSVEIISP